jgi:hypothetical protein
MERETKTLSRLERVQSAANPEAVNQGYIQQYKGARRRRYGGTREESIAPRARADERPDLLSGVPRRGAGVLTLRVADHVVIIGSQLSSKPG